MASSAGHWYLLCIGRRAGQAAPRHAVTMSVIRHRLVPSGFPDGAGCPAALDPPEMRRAREAIRRPVHHRGHPEPSRASGFGHRHGYLRRPRRLRRRRAISTSLARVVVQRNYASVLAQAASLYAPNKVRSSNVTLTRLMVKSGLKLRRSSIAAIPLPMVGDGTVSAPLGSSE